MPKQKKSGNNKDEANSPQSTTEQGVFNSPKLVKPVVAAKPVASVKPAPAVKRVVVAQAVKRVVVAQAVKSAPVKPAAPAPSKPVVSTPTQPAKPLAPAIPTSAKNIKKLEGDPSSFSKLTQSLKNFFSQTPTVAAAAQAPTPAKPQVVSTPTQPQKKAVPSPEPPAPTLAKNNKKLEGSPSYLSRITEKFQYFYSQTPVVAAAPANSTPPLKQPVVSILALPPAEQSVVSIPALPVAAKPSATAKERATRTRLDSKSFKELAGWEGSDEAIQNSQLSYGLENSLVSQRADSRGYTIRSIPGDGACLFRAVAYKLFDSEDEDPKHLELRQIVYETVLDDQNRYLGGYNEQQRQEYLSELKSPFGWGDHVALQILANHFGYTIVLVHDFKDNQEPILINPKGEKSNREIWLGFRHENHYDALILKNEE